ncbi:hypothetical protein [Clostridium merdae]|uniref:hypothetical protein n=1 Tax=Clostridium merdae TaxID=1958780 RepID=UPI000A267A4A|nr:hypothetical protein [Clostridium merdae]
MFSTNGGSTTENEENLTEQSPVDDQSPSFVENEIAPQEPKKKLNPAIIAVISILVVVVGIFAVGKLFFNRDFSQLLEGKTKYAQKIELTTAKQSANFIVTGLDKGHTLLQTYTKPKTMESNMQLNLKFEDEFLKDSGLSKEDSETMQKLVSYINSLKVDSKLLINKEGMQSSFVLKDPSALKLSINTLSYEDGKMYVQFPELLDKYLDTGNSTLSPYSLAKTKYDSAKLKASLNKLADIYAGALANAEVTAQNDASVTVDGETVQGQKLTASLTEQQTAELVNALAKAVKEDEYLFTMISDNYNLYSNLFGDTKSKTLTKEQFDSEIDKMFFIKDLDINKPAFSATSYIAQNGALLAHSYTIKETSDTTNLTYLIAEKKQAVELMVNEKSALRFSNTMTEKDAGRLQLNAIAEKGTKTAGLNVDYSAAKIVPYLDYEILTGKYTITLNDPDKEIENTFKGTDIPASFRDFHKMSLTVDTALNGDELQSAISFAVPKLMTVSATEKSRGTIGETTIPTKPEASKVVDLTTIESNEAANELSINTIKYLAETMKKDPELTALLANFGITQEQMEALASYYSQN